MIINIPIHIEDGVIEGMVAKDYEEKVTQAIYKEIERALIAEDTSYYNKTAQKGMVSIIEKRIDDILDDNRKEIIDAAADRLAERLRRTKKIKEVEK